MSGMPLIRRQLRTTEQEGGLHQRIARNTNSAPYSSLDLPSLWPSQAGPDSVEPGES